MNRYLLGSENMFYDFVDSLNKKDKIGIVTHIDLDGLASTVFLQKILESKNLKVNSIEFLNYGPGALKSIINKKRDILFFTDWNADSYLKDFEKLRNKSKIFVIDHHPLNTQLKDSSNFIKTEGSYCSTHTLFDLAKNGNYFDTKFLEWLVCAAMITDYTWDKGEENFKFIQSIYPKIKKNESIWNSKPGEIGKTIDNSLTYYSPNFKKVYDLVLKNNLKELNKSGNIVRKEIDKWIDKFKGEVEIFSEQRLNFYYGNPKYNIASKVSSKLSDEYFRTNTVLFASDIPEKKGFIKLSARNQTGEVNLGEILKTCVKNLKNADGGGHARAASCVIMKKDLNKFKNNLLLELGKKQNEKNR